jgi:ketosteroid isomerase-like protein
LPTQTGSSFRHTAAVPLNVAMPYQQTYCFVFRLRDGKLTEVIEHCDTGLVERVLEQPGRKPPGPQGA